MDAPSPVAAEIATLHGECRVRLESGLPTRLRRTEYYEALCLADAALQLAVEAALNAEVVAACEALQKRCEDVLRGWYSVRDQRERDAYERAVAAARPASTPPVLARHNSEPETMLSSVWWAQCGAVIDEEQHPTNFTPVERRSIIASLRVRTSMAAGLPYRSR